jgi:hypothetical protein
MLPKMDRSIATIAAMLGYWSKEVKGMEPDRVYDRGRGNNLPEALDRRPVVARVTMGEIIEELKKTDPKLLDAILKEQHG